MLEINKIYQGDALELMKQLDTESVDFCITSPPYWGLRNYQVEGQIGLEEHPQQYINKLVEIFSWLRKALKKSGSFYLNLGDVYFGTSTNDGLDEIRTTGIKSFEGIQRRCTGTPDGSNWLRAKQLMMIPSRTAIALQEDGWLLRNFICWFKPSHMPSSVTDRLTNSWESVFHFVKNKKYFYNLNAIREPHSEASLKDLKRRTNMEYYKNNGTPQSKWFGTKLSHDKEGRLRNEMFHPQGKNPGDVFEINPQPFLDAHFAVFPINLLRKPILSSVPDEVCKKCGIPREPIFDENTISQRKPESGKMSNSNLGNDGLRDGFKLKSHVLKGYTNCGCEEGWEGGLCLDPFMGAGTTIVALRKYKPNARWIGIELKKEYIDIAYKRIGRPKKEGGLWNFAKKQPDTQVPISL